MEAQATVETAARLVQPLIRYLSDPTIRSPALVPALRMKRCLERRVWDIPELELQQVGCMPRRVARNGFNLHATPCRRSCKA
jgi:hypothetical protein